MGGLPGAGKSTHALELEATLGAIRFEPDAWMEALGIDLHDEPARDKVEALQWQLCQQVLSRGLTAAIEWGTWGRWERDRLRLRARELGARVELHYLSAPPAVLFERVCARNRERVPITLADLERWSALMEAPTPDELALYDAAWVSELPG